MANKDKKSAAQQAAQQAAAKQAAPEVKIPETNRNPQTKGMSQEAKASYLASVQAERAYMLNNSEKPNMVIIDGLTMLAQATILDVAVTEIASGKSALGYIITANEKNYNMFQAIAAENGVSLPDFKSLPAPSKEDLEAVGLSGVGTQAKLLTVTSTAVSEKAVEQKKTETKVADKAKTIDNPAEIENEEQLKASLTALLVKPITSGPDGVHPRIQRTINFYNGYLTIQANKAENSEEELKKVKAKTMVELLTEISEIVGPCTFAMNGAASFLRNSTAETNNVISAFCLYRRTSANKKGSTVNDENIADLVHVLLNWSCNSQIANAKRTIAECDRIIAKNEKIVKENKDAKEVTIAKAAIKKWTDEKNKPTEIINQMTDVLNIVNNPSHEMIVKLIDNYKLEDTESEEYKLAHRVVSEIMRTYYADLKINELDQDVMLKNVQQRAGIIVNLFRDPLSRSINYSETNLVEMVKKAAEEEK
jgi:hypothetical protein